MTNVTELKIDPEFQSQIPPLTDDEFEQLKENILSTGEVYEPIIVWNGTIIDGHNRWRIIKDNWEQLKNSYRTKEMDFPNKWAAIDWMFRNQLGRRNLTKEMYEYSVGKMYEARKKAESFKGNQYTKSGGGQNVHHHFAEVKKQKTADIIGSEVGMTGKSVRRAEKFAQGVDALKNASTDAADKVLRGQSGITKVVINDIPNMESTEIEEIASAIVSGDPVSRKGINQKYSKSRGWTKKDREERAKLDAIAADMYDRSTVPEYTVDSLVDDIQLCAQEFVQQIKNTLKDRSTVLTDENKPIIAEAIDLYIIKEIEKVRILLK